MNIKTKDLETEIVNLYYSSLKQVSDFKTKKSLKLLQGNDNIYKKKINIIV